MESVKYWDSVTDIENCQPSKLNRSNGAAQRMRGKLKTQSAVWWYGVSGGVAEVEKVAKYGWQEGAAKARKAIGELDIQSAKSKRRIRKFGDFGDTVDIQKVYKGQSDRAWEYRTRRTVDSMGQSVMRAYVDVGAQGHMDANNLFWRGAVASMLIDAFETSGRQCEVYGFSHGSGRYDRPEDRHCNIFKIKDGGQFLDFEKLITVTALTGWYRVFMFKAFMSEEKKRAADGMGRSIYRLPDSVRQEGDLVIENINNKSEAIAFLKKAIWEFNSEG